MSRIYTVATAGHVDHGKSSLVRALTGIDPDRLAEEKRREMTIDLGFAWLTLPEAGTVGIVDVPGHRDFMDNMLAGIGGIDAVMLIVAADEGLMPQTREHLTILDLLGVSRGLVALTKTDLIAEEDWLALVQDEIASVLETTSLAGAPVVPVSAYSGYGLDNLRRTLTALLIESPLPPASGLPRLPVDRVFTLSGFGTVVTGTLRGGALRLGDDVALLPGSVTGRIRGLQSHKQPVQTAQPGARVAINLTGVDRDQAARGQTLTLRGQWRTTALIDVSLTVSASAERPLTHHLAVKLHWGSAAINGHVRLLDADALEPSEHGFGQIVLDSPLVLADGDRFILRVPSPEMTVAGGTVVDAHPARRWRRRDERTLERLAARAEATPAQQLARLAAPEPVSPTALRKTAIGLDANQFDAILQDARRTGDLVALPDGSLLSAERLTMLRGRIFSELAAFHRSFPLRLGMPREALRSRLGVRAATLPLVLDQWDTVIVENDLVRLAEHQLRFTPEQERVLNSLRQTMQAAGYTPPSYTDAVRLGGEELVLALLDTGEWVRVQADVIFPHTAYDELVAGALALIDQNGSVSAAELRDRFDTSRKYAIALLEHLDSRGITQRRGDLRVRNPRA